jgi:voltage-gated potassium channel
MTGEKMKRAIDWWVKASPKFLQIMGLLFLSAYALPIINPEISPNVSSICRWILVIVWILFAIDYFVRLSVANDKKKYFRSNLLDFAAVALPVLPLLRAVRALVAVTSVSRKTSASRSRDVTTSVVVLAVATWFVAGLAVTEAERGVPGANIEGVGDGWWWALTTMSTVGYGDEFPISTSGRIVGVALMIMGVALLGTITAALASNFNGARNAHEQSGKKVTIANEDSLDSKLDAVLREIELLRKQVSDKEKND